MGRSVSKPAPSPPSQDAWRMHYSRGAGVAARWYGACVRPRRSAEARSPVAEGGEDPHQGAREGGLESARPRLMNFYKLIG